MQVIQREPIAIVGIGCRFPGADGPKEFWKLLCEGRDAICEVPTGRWDINQVYSSDPSGLGKTISRWGGFIDQIDQFDWRAFRILPREARFMDPQHRLLLEVAWEALEDAGIPFEQIAGSRTSVFIGISWNDYLRLQARKWSQLGEYTATGNISSFAANRISYFFDLKGPSVSLDAGCTSSLMSGYLACQSLWTGEASLALVGGVNLMISPDSTIMASKTGLLSPEGKCKTLDADADGYVRGEGAGIIVLKPLALSTSSDRVYAVIHTIEVNHNGHNEWIIAPSETAQRQLLQRAYSEAGIAPIDVDYVELHGTGFLRGDAIEVKALSTVVSANDERQQPCLIGSVKTNIGHLEAAAGVASLIKVALSLYYQQIPPTLNLENENPNLHLNELQLAAVRKLCAWPSKEGHSYAGVTTLALSGANAHAVLAKRPSLVEIAWTREDNDCEFILPLSARSRQALFAQIVATKHFLCVERAEYSWRDICYTASIRRTHHNYRSAVVARSAEEAASILDEFIRGRLSSKMAIQDGNPDKQKVTFVFTNLHVHKLRAQASMLKRWPIIQETLKKCNQDFFQYRKKEIFTTLDPNDFFKYDDDIEIRCVKSFALQVALVSLWQSWNITPDVIIGDGIGKIVATYIAGTLSMHSVLKEITAYSSQTKTKSEERFSNISLRSASLPLYLSKNSLVSNNVTSVANKWNIQALPLNEIANKVIEDEYNLCIFFGPFPIFSEKIKLHSHHKSQVIDILSTLGDDENCSETNILITLSMLYTVGYKVNWLGLDINNGKCISLTMYPWQRESLWTDWLSVEEISTSPE